MSGRRWLEHIECELTRNKLPRQEVARLLAELSDHLADHCESQLVVGACSMHGAAGNEFFTPFKEDEMSMDASLVESLGSPAEVAETAVREFRRRKNLLSRSPWAAFCTFVVLPLPTLLLAWSATLVMMILLGELLHLCGVPDPSASREVTGWQVILVYLVLHLIVLAPASGVAVLFGRLARKTLFPWRWGMVAALIVALGTGLVNCQATFSELPGKSMVMFGLGIGKTLIPLTGLGQFLIPLAAGWLVLRRQKNPAPAV